MNKSVENREQDGKQEPVEPLEGSNELAVKRLNDLSTKDWQICMRIAQGDSGPEIAELMGLKLQTIHNRLNKLFKEISVRNRYELAAWTGAQLCEAELASKDATIAELRKDVEKLQGRRREHTHNWYSSHYAKLHGWARKILPEPYRNQFFSCVANGTWGHEDVGEAYTCKAGFRVVPSGYIPMNDAKGQIIREQTTRAEDAEATVAEQAAKITWLQQELTQWKNKAGNFTADVDVYPAQVVDKLADVGAWEKDHPGWNEGELK